MTAAKSTPNFRTLMRSIGNREKVVPLLRTALWDPRFPSFTVGVEAFSPRPPDGWFHPSTHPLWNERQLYTYLAQPELLRDEPMDPTGTLAVTAGTFFHTFVQTVLVREGVLVKQPVVCPCGVKHPERAEVHLVDEEVGSRGHSDGVTYDHEGFEFKSMNPAKMAGIPKTAPDAPEMLAWFKTKCADYYAQAQEYLRISERRLMVVVILSMVYPFEMRELHIPYDPPAALAVRDKYRRVRQAVEEGRPPMCGCTIKAVSECVSRGACA